jgi:hypothetical protein
MRISALAALAVTISDALLCNSILCRLNCFNRNSDCLWRRTSFRHRTDKLRQAHATAALQGQNGTVIKHIIGCLLTARKQPKCATGEKRNWLADILPHFSDTCN